MKILVVDDVETNRMLLRRMLTVMLGYTVIEAVNGKHALDLFVEESPDLVLMDISMPEMDGMQSASEIKKISGDSYIPIIFVTALSEESSLAEALASGGDDFINKPFDVEVLKSKMNAHLRIRDLNNQLNTKNKQLLKLNQLMSKEQELIEHFFESALQQSFLDKNIINYHMSSMSSFNGDVLLAERGPQGNLSIVMGDFTGHGLTAAMGTLPVAVVFFKMVSEGATLADIARELNKQLYKLMPTSMFFAATLFEMNSSGNSLTSWTGGMPDSYWFGSNGELKGELKSRHVALGILNENSFDASTEEFSTDEGDKIYMYSDGVTETQNPDGDMFGSERLKDALVRNSDDRIEHVISELNNFKRVTEQNDDITLVELSCYEVPE